MFCFIARIMLSDGLSPSGARTIAGTGRPSPDHMFWWHVRTGLREEVRYHRGMDTLSTLLVICEGNQLVSSGLTLQWASYHIRKIAGCACAGNVFPPHGISDPDMHHGTCVTHVLWCMPGSLTSSFPWNRWLRKRSQHSRCMHNPHAGNKVKPC